MTYKDSDRHMKILRKSVRETKDETEDGSKDTVRYRDGYVSGYLGMDVREINTHRDQANVIQTDSETSSSTGRDGMANRSRVQT